MWVKCFAPLSKGTLKSCEVHIKFGGKEFKMCQKIKRVVAFAGFSAKSHIVVEPLVMRARMTQIQKKRGFLGWRSLTMEPPVPNQLTTVSKPTCRFSEWYKFFRV